MDWLSQHIRKVGEMYLTAEEKKFHLENEDSNIIFLRENEEAYISIIFSCPLEYGMNGPTGFKYDALKDYISWNYDKEIDLEEIYKEHLSTLLQLGSALANEISSNRKK